MSSDNLRGQRSSEEKCSREACAIYQLVELIFFWKFISQS